MRDAREDRVRPAILGSMASITARTTAPDGMTLHERRWIPDGEPWARVELVHGLGEHLGRWEPVGDLLAAHGLEVRGADLRGFGASGGPRADVDRWSRYLGDLEARLEAIPATEPRLPVVLYGHSMGAVIALGQVLSGGPSPDALVLTGPAVDDDLARWKHAVAPLFGRVTPTLRMSNGITAEQLVAHPRSGFSYDDPLLLTTSTMRLGAFGFEEQVRLRDVLAGRTAMPIPTLAIRGDDDPIVPARVLPMLRRLDNVTVRTYPGLRHEVHNEATGDAVLEDVVSWLRGHLRAAV